MKKWVALLALVLVLGLINHSIYQKEAHLDSGKRVLLELAPVDPRSLMQGDYMALRFAVGQQIIDALSQEQDPQNNKDGRVIVQLDENNVAHFVALYQGQSLALNQMTLLYRLREGRVKFATNAFFFEEGSGQRYEQAQFGEFRVNQEGEPLMTHLLDEQYQQL